MMLPLFSRNITSKHKLDPSRKKQLKQLCKKLKIRVRSLSLLDRALTHTSYLNRKEKQIKSYERLEFLGDSVLNASVSLSLFNRNADFKEGKMSSLRSSLVDEKTLSEISIQLELDKYVNLGKGERLNDQRARRKVSADVVESIVGVLFLEKGFNYARRFVQRLMAPYIHHRLEKGVNDHKSKLQRISLERYKKYPEYVVIKEIGPDHNKLFEIEVSLEGRYKEKGLARSKKEAEQQAAYKALKAIAKI